MSVQCVIYWHGHAMYINFILMIMGSVILFCHVNTFFAFLFKNIVFCFQDNDTLFIYNFLWREKN